VKRGEISLGLAAAILPPVGQWVTCRRQPCLLRVLITRRSWVRIPPPLVKQTGSEEPVAQVNAERRGRRASAFCVLRKPPQGLANGCRPPASLASLRRDTPNGRPFQPRPRPRPESLCVSRLSPPAGLYAGCLRLDASRTVAVRAAWAQRTDIIESALWLFTSQGQHVWRGRLRSVPQEHRLHAPPQLPAASRTRAMVFPVRHGMATGLRAMDRFGPPTVHHAPRPLGDHHGVEGSAVLAGNRGGGADHAVVDPAR
jgi:hypothetical protein